MLVLPASQVFDLACDGDLRPRFWLNGAMPEPEARTFEGRSILLHGEPYLAERLSYELALWTSGLHGT